MTNKRGIILRKWNKYLWDKLKTVMTVLLTSVVHTFDGDSRHFNKLFRSIGRFVSTMLMQESEIPKLVYVSSNSSVCKCISRYLQDVCLLIVTKLWKIPYKNGKHFLWEVYHNYKKNEIDLWKPSFIFRCNCRCNSWVKFT